MNNVDTCDCYVPGNLHELGFEPSCPMHGYEAQRKEAFRPLYDVHEEIRQARADFGLLYENQAAEIVELRKVVDMLVEQVNERDAKEWRDRINAL